MGRRKKRIVHELAIIDVAEGGKCVAKKDDLVVFVKGAVPGDVVDVKVTKKKKNYLEGQAIHFHKKSEDRVEPFCEHFGLCGGCKWQHLTYEKQLEYKQKVVVDSLERIGKIQIPETLPILPSGKNRFYRNKLEFTFTAFRWLTQTEILTDIVMERRGVGFHIPGRFDKVLDIQKCYLQDEPSNGLRDEVRVYALKRDLSFFDLSKNEGFLRNMVIRTASTGDVMVIVQFFVNDEPAIHALLDHLMGKFPNITSLQYVVNQKLNDTFQDQKVICYHGKPYIIEEMEGLQFRIGPKSFYQTNSEQAYELYKVVRDFARLKGGEVVYDLYTGTGTIALFLARHCAEVIGLEYVQGAIDDAKVNAEINGIGNSQFYAGDIRYLLDEGFLAEHPAPDVIITDPPRAGMHPDVVKMLLRISAPRIVYVSCNPGTQARDLEVLSEKYEVIKIQPVDMFPHTHHVENVALLELKA